MHLLKSFAQTSVESLEQVSDSVNPASLSQAVQILADAQIIYLQATRRSFPVTSYLGYAFVRVRPGALFAVSWSASDPLAELAILAVLPEARGKGVGSALLDAVEARLRELQIDDMVIDVITTNTDAMRLYERRGALPFLTNFVQRVATPRSV